MQAATTMSGVAIPGWSLMSMNACLHCDWHVYTMCLKKATVMWHSNFNADEPILFLAKMLLREYAIKW